MVSDFRPQETYQFFLQEAPELVRALERGVMTLHQTHDTDQLEDQLWEVMRIAHSMKGGAACSGLEDIQHFCHQFESTIKLMIEKVLPLDQTTESDLFEAVDHLKLAIIDERQSGSSQSLSSRAQSLWERIQTRLPDDVTFLLGEQERNESQKDVVELLFAEDVTKGIKRLHSLLKVATASLDATDDMLEPFRTQVEILRGIGEISHLPGFCAIASTTLAALQQHPDQWIDIATVAIANFESAYHAVVEGDRLQGGHPWPDLLKYSPQSDQEEITLSIGLAQDDGAPDALPLTIPQLSNDSVDFQEAVGLEGRGINNMGIAGSGIEEIGGDTEPPSSPSLAEPAIPIDSPPSLSDEVSPGEIFPEVVQLAPFVPPTEIAPEVAPDTSIAQDPATNAYLDINPHPADTTYIRPETSQTSPVPPLQSNPNDADHVPVLLSATKDWEQVSALNPLIGELVTLGSRNAVHDHQSQEILAIGNRSYLRLKQLVTDLNQGINQFASTTRLSQGYASQPPNPFNSRWTQQQQLSRFQNSIQDITEEIAQLGEVFKDFHLLKQQHQQLLRQHKKTLKQVQEQLLHAQMLPIEELLDQFPRMVRQLSFEHNKPVELTLEGENTLLEKAVLERLYDPLVHLVRNAFDHGIESPDMRQALGKKRPATISIRAWHQGNHTYLEVTDDGKGIDPDIIRHKLLEQAWLDEQTANSLLPHQLYDYLFHPNFSTASYVSQLSGRGMGLYAVQTQIHALKGSIRITSQLGKHTSFTLRLPLTSTVTKVLLFMSHRQTFAIPIDSVVSITYATPESIESSQNYLHYRWNQQLIPLCSLNQLFSYRYPLPSLSREVLTKSELFTIENSPTDESDINFPLILATRDDQIVAFRVDEVLNEKEVVIKPFVNLPFQLPDYFQGAILLGDGCLVPVLNGPALINQYLKVRYAQATIERYANLDRSENVISTILIVDDSLTIRSALSLTLRKAGYRVLQAKDGWEATDFLRQGTVITAIICDIEMPHMNGLEFLSRCRRQQVNIPIMMLTYRSSERYKLLAKQLGASAYMTKPYLDKELLTVLRQLLER